MSVERVKFYETVFRLDYTISAADNFEKGLFSWEPMNSKLTGAGDDDVAVKKTSIAIFTNKQ